MVTTRGRGIAVMAPALVTMMGTGAPALVTVMGGMRAPVLVMVGGLGSRAPALSIFISSTVHPIPPCSPGWCLKLK